MKRSFLCFAIFVVVSVFTLSGQNARLSRQQADAEIQKAVSAWHHEMEKNLSAEWNSECIQYDTLRLRFWKHFYGDAPVGKRSMYISLHGGGGVPAEINNGQWENQKRLYSPKEGLYIAPRAPWNAWNMWFKPGMNELLERLIAAAVVFEGVNPDQVYLLGYSAGGDGVWRLATRLADHWAAASMMAGHPGNVSLESLRNLPFMIWMGGRDFAYDRNKLAAERGQTLDSLQQTDEGGYVHETHILEGLPHWMMRRDTLALPWMANFDRNPFPERIVWRQDMESPRRYFYWIETEGKMESLGGKLAIVSRKGNTIYIKHCDTDRLTFWLNDKMFNLDRKIKVVGPDGKVLFNDKVPRTSANIHRSLTERCDPRYVFPSCLSVRVRY